MADGGQRQVRSRQGRGRVRVYRNLFYSFAGGDIRCPVYIKSINMLISKLKFTVTGLDREKLKKMHLSITPIFAREPRRAPRR